MSEPSAPEPGVPLRAALMMLALDLAGEDVDRGIAIVLKHVPYVEAALREQIAGELEAEAERMPTETATESDEQAGFARAATFVRDGCGVPMRDQMIDAGLWSADDYRDPSVSIEAAWEVFEKLSDRLPCIMLNQPNENHPREWCVEWFDGKMASGAVSAVTMSRVCLAALRAVEGLRARNKGDAT